MTTEEYYSLLEKKHKSTDWDNIASVRAYNEYARMLRSMLEQDD